MAKLLGTLVVVIALSFFLKPIVGTTDFIQYYSAFGLILQGQNPYDPSLMSEFQKSLGSSKTIMSWNPPWTYLIMSPILILPYQQAAACWLLLNICFLLGTIYMCHSIYSHTDGRFVNRPYKLVLFSFVFIPAFSCISFGQTGLLLSFTLCAGMYLIKNKKFLWAGVLLSILAIKPHLFYLLIPLFIYHAFSERNFRIIAGTLLGLIILLIATRLNSHLMAHWLDAMLFPTKLKGAESILEWKVATLVGFIKTLVFKFSGSVPKWPMSVVPLITFCFLSLMLIKKKPKIDLLTSIPPLLALSLFTSPYGWLFDQSLLLCLHVMLMLRALENSDKMLLTTLLGLQGILILQKALPFSAQHHFFWFPLALFVVVVFFGLPPGIQNGRGRSPAPTRKQS